MNNRSAGLSMRSLLIQALLAEDSIAVIEIADD